MLRRTSVVITTTGASPLIALSPVSRPTLLGAVRADEVAELLVRERFQRRRVEGLGRPPRARGAMAYSATSVLPEPVGAATSTDRPASSASSARVWKSSSGNGTRRRERRARTSRWSGSAVIRLRWSGVVVVAVRSSSPASSRAELVGVVLDLCRQRRVVAHDAARPEDPDEHRRPRRRGPADDRRRRPAPSRVAGGAGRGTATTRASDRRSPRSMTSIVTRGWRRSSPRSPATPGSPGPHQPDEQDRADDDADAGRDRDDHLATRTGPR